MEFRKSTPADIDEMMQIVNDAKLLLKKQNINQWQTGYPNRPLLEKDIADGIGYVLCDSSRIAGMCAITFGADESYEKIEGGWKTTGSNYAVVHRMAVAADSHGKGLGVKIYEEAEKLARSRQRPGRYPPRKHCNAAHYGKKRLSAVRHHPYQGRRRRRTTAHRRGETIVLKKMRYHMNEKQA